MSTVHVWQTQCKQCHAKLEKRTLQTPWKCWRCSWSTEDTSRTPPVVWDGVSQRPEGNGDK